MNQRLHDVFIEDFRKELNEIQLPLARKLFVLAKASHLVHLQVGGYVALIAAADTLGHPGVGVLLESCLADKARVRGENEASDPRTHRAKGRRRLEASFWKTRAAHRWEGALEDGESHLSALQALSAALGI